MTNSFYENFNSIFLYVTSDIAGGKEEVPIPCVNGVDEDELPKDYLYIAENCEASNVTIDRTITSLKVGIFVDAYFLGTGLHCISEKLFREDLMK